MNILIAGGAGFIGSHLVELFLKKGNNLWIVDNLSSGLESRMKQYEQEPNLQVIRQDIRQPLHVTKPLDVIFHFACMASPVDYMNSPIDVYMTNAQGTYNLLELAREHKARFVLASTSEIYGNPLIHPQVETYFGNTNPVGVRSCYDEGKRFAEGLTMQYNDTYQVDTRIIRIFNTYGPGMRKNDGRVISNFITQAISNEAITIYGDGSQTRSFCYITDLIEGIYLFSSIDGLNGEIINLGNPSEISIKDLVDKIQSFFKEPITREYKELPLDDPKQRRPDISKAKSLLSWEPLVPLCDGLEKIIEYFENIKMKAYFSDDGGMKKND
jgi:dTDP-glucose 4,6-dehydratase